MPSSDGDSGSSERCCDVRAIHLQKPQGEAEVIRLYADALERIRPELDHRCLAEIDPLPDGALYAECTLEPTREQPREEERQLIAERSVWLSRHQLLLFFVLTYAITIAATLASSYWPSIPLSVWMIPQILSPSIVAIILTWAIGGPDAVKRLLLRFLHWRVGFAWYLAAFALFWIPLVYALVYAALGFPVPGMAPGINPWFLLAQLAYTLYAGPLAEEAGWRGFALPRLQERFSALTSSLILGVIWAGWHLPFYALSGGNVGIPFPAYVALVTIVTVFITWVYNNTRGSLLLCVLAHFSFNLSSAFIAGHLGLLPQMVFNIGASVGLTALVVAIVWYFGPRHLVKQEKSRIAAQG